MIEEKNMSEQRKIIHDDNNGLDYVLVWIRTGNRHRSEQNAFGRFYTLYPACTFWLGGDVAGNNQNQIDGRLKRWN